MTDVDKAIRAAMLTAKNVKPVAAAGFDSAAQNIADYVAELLREGRASEVTNDLMAQADPQRLWMHYKNGNTGMDLPMDFKSRMARAGEMGLTEDTIHGTLASKDFKSFKGEGRLGQENYVAPNTEDGRKLAAQFSTADQGRILPLLTPKPMDTRNLDDRLRFEQMMDDKNRLDDFRMKGGYRASGLPGWGDQWAIDTANEAGEKALRLHERDWVDSTAVFDPRNMRSQFARFDPRLSHLSDLNAATGGAILDKRHHQEAVERAGGQIAPSKYLPGVPRQFHADGGRAEAKDAFLAGNHPLVPDVLYHGTARDVQSFDPQAKRSYDVDPLNPEETDTGWFGKGHYFTASPKMADHYATEGARRQGGEGANVIPVHVSMKNPFVVNMKEYDSGATTLDQALTRAGVPMHPRGWRKPSEQTAALMQMGHDGVIATREGKPKEYVAFKPEQVKSAISARQFDPTNPDMTYADGGKVVYHGTGEDYDLSDAFMPMHFTEDMDTARDFADNYDDGKPRIIKARLAFKNPLRATSAFVDRNFRPVEIGDLKGGEIDLQNLRGKDLEYVRNAGYDGITFPWGEHVALHRDVIRAARADGGEVTDLGQVREQRQLQGFHKGMMGDIASAASERMEAHQKAIDAGVFDGYEVGDTLQGGVHPMRITGRFVRPWKPSTTVLSHFDRIGVKPTIIEHNGKQYIPMLRYQTGKEGFDGFQEGDSYLDMVKHLGYRKMGGLRAVKADGGAIHLIHGGSDFEEIDPRFSGTGEPGGIRPLGKGLYTYVIDPEDPDRAKDAIGWAKRYATKYGRGKKTLHVFRVPKSASTVFNGPRNIAGLGAEPQDKLEAYRAHRAAEPAKDDPAWWDWSRKGNALYEDVKNAADLRMEHLPIGLTEAAINNPKIAQRVGKFDPDADPEEIIKAIRGYADGGMVDDQDEDITAYHGSPHDFDAFDISKLGTGEGAQSYGHGLYFAGNEGIAKHYRDALSDRNAPLGSFKKRDGSELDILHTPNGIYSLLGGDEPRNTDYDRLIAAANEKLQWAQSRKGPLREVHSKNAQEVLDFLKANEGLRFERNPARGHMYKVKLRVKPHELLDWDKPLSQQHPNVQAAIKDIGVDTSAREWKNGADLGNGNRLIVTPHPDLPDDEQFTKYEMQTPLGVRINLDRRDVERLLGKGDDLTGAQIHQRLVDMGNQQGAIGEHLRAGNPMKSGPKWAAEALMRHGIKGIRYLDANSRLSTADKQTHNYVMFHHDPVKVVDKYEYGGAVEKSGGGSMGDGGDNPTDLGAARALRNFNQNSTGPTAAAEGVFNRLAAARDAAASAHEEAIKDGVFKSAQIGDVFKYKPLDTYAPMKVVDHGMAHVSRWGGINPPKYVYQDHFPVAEVQYQDASKERRKVPIELLEDRSRYDFISGKPRIARADGGRLDLYSKAARIIRGMKDRKMDVADILEYAKGKGAKRTEIAHVDVPPGKATPSQVAEHIEFMQPQIGVHKREMFYRYKDPERYERQIDYLERQGRHDEAEELTREFEAFEGYGGKDAPLYAKYQLPGGENYREHVLTLDNHPDDQTYTAPIHWGKLKNPLAHIRMSDRIIGNKKILHIEEMQSDWNNDARKVGFRTGREKQDYEDYVAQMRQKAIDKVKARTGQDYYDPMTGETAPTMSPMVAQAQIEKYQRMDPYTLALKMGMHDEHRRMADAAKGGSGVPRAPYINPEKDDVYEMAMKHVLMEAAKGGYDGIAFTPDEEQELRWPGHTFKGIYNKRLPGIAQRLVQPHDTDANVDDMTRLNGWAVPMIPLSDKARDSIMQNGFSSFRRGGMVDAALAATRHFTKDGQHVTMRLKD